jgi:hypothetical protein
MAQRKQQIKGEEPQRPIVKAMTKNIRCVWIGKLIVPAERTPSGTQYNFERGQIQQVLEVDYNFLLSIERNSNTCCGGKSSMVYFEEVK